MLRMKGILGAMALFFGLTLATCGGGSSGSASVKTTDDNGTLSVYLADTTTTEFQAIYVTIKEIQIHTTANGWDPWPNPTRPSTFRNWSVGS